MLGPKQPERSPGWSRVSSPRPHLASECLSAPSKGEGWSGQQHCGAGVTWWWRLDWLCIQPGPLLTQAAACCFQGNGMLSFFLSFFFLKKIWNASRICVSSLCRGHANLLCIVPILVYVLPKRARMLSFLTCLSRVLLAGCS